MAPIEILDASRGTALWGLNRFREDALTKLFDDLVALEHCGLEPQQCDQVHQTFQMVANRFSAWDDGSLFRSSILRMVESLTDRYHEWNKRTGEDQEARDHRRRAMKNLRRARQKLSRVARRNQRILAKELDLQLVEDVYGALGGLAKAMPELFKELTKAIARFNSRAEQA